MEAWRACCGNDKSLDGLRSRVLGCCGGANAEYEDCVSLQARVVGCREGSAGGARLRLKGCESGRGRGEGEGEGKVVVSWWWRCKVGMGGGTGKKAVAVEKLSGLGRQLAASGVQGLGERNKGEGRHVYRGGLARWSDTCVGCASMSLRLGLANALL